MALHNIDYHEAPEDEISGGVADKAVGIVDNAIENFDEVQQWYCSHTKMDADAFASMYAQHDWEGLYNYYVENFVNTLNPKWQEQAYREYERAFGLTVTGEHPGHFEDAEYGATPEGTADEVNGHISEVLGGLPDEAANSDMERNEMPGSDERMAA